MLINSCAHLSDRELLDTISRAAGDNRRTAVELLMLLGELDARRLYLPEGCSSLFTYCTQVLHFSEHEAYHRIEAARAARQFPVILERLRDGALTVTSVTILRPHLTPANADALIAAASHKSKREVEHQMASLAARPDATSLIRRLPDTRPAASLVEGPTAIPAAVAPVALRRADPIAPPSPRPIRTPLSGDRYLLRVTLSADAHANLKRAQDLLRHSDPSGDPGAIVARALTLLVDELERRRLAHVRKPRSTNPPQSPARSTSRHIPAAVRRDVWARDGGRCAFAGAHGRCRETGRLEFHHVEAFALGGAATTGNIELRCRAHNQFEGELLFGAGHLNETDAPTRPGPS
jgi:hypothetical protein